MTGPAAIAFPGQGGDWRSAVAALDGAPGHPLVEALARRLGTSTWADLDGRDTAVAQPVIYVAGLVAAPRAGSEVTLAMGHSLGEITAAAWAGAMDHEAGLDLMVARGMLGDRLTAVRPGAMVAVNRWDRDQVEGLRARVLDQGPVDGVLDVAVVNSPTQIVLSGDAALVDAATEIANDQGAVARKLPIGGAYHSSLMEPSVEAFAARAGETVTDEPRVPVLSSTSQRLMTTPTGIAEGVTASLTRAVDWPATVEAAVAFGVTAAVEAGPGDTLRRLARFAPGLVFTTP